MKINFEKINELTKLGIFRDSSLLVYIQHTLDYLEAHNKNYTKKQYHLILELKTFFENIEA